VRAGEQRLALLKPETYMNESGRSVGAAARFFKLPAEQTLLVHDDVDLEEGRLQARLGGGLAGHNGLRSIAQHLGTNDFLRLRIGVGRPGRGDRRSVADYVLSPFEPEVDVDALVARAADAVEQLAADGLEATQRAVN
jgi:PTH1 family peptidyl-tRNA hydrolase